MSETAYTCPHGNVARWCAECRAATYAPMPGGFHVETTSPWPITITSSAIGMICPDHLGLRNLGVADTWRGRFIRFVFAWIDIVWPSH